MDVNEADKPKLNQNFQNRLEQPCLIDQRVRPGGGL